jgi:hypothetical protein
MKSKTLIKLYTTVAILFFACQISQAQSSCGSHSDAEYESILKKAADAAISGNETDHDKFMDDARTLIMDDIMLAVSQPMPSTNGLYCRKNPVTDYAACCLKLSARSELLGVGNMYPEVALRRAKEAIDFWTKEFANTMPPAGDEQLCRDYLKCIYKAMAQRELMGIEHSETDDLLQAKADEILKKGCKACETRWMAFAQVDISWQSDEETVKMAGNASWENFFIIVNMPELEDRCMTIDNDDRLTFPFACDGGVISNKGGKFNPQLQLTRGDATFAKSMVDASIILCCSDTHNPSNLRMLCYMGFDNHGQQFEIPIADKVGAIKNRKPFTVTMIETNEEIPSYKANLKVMFFPVWK